MMRIRKLCNIIRDSLWNIIRHPLVSLASLTTVTLMLLLLGSFVTVSFLASHMTRALAQQPPIEIWCESSLTAEDQALIEQYLERDSNVLNWQKRTPEQNYQLLRESMGDRASVLDQFPADKLQYTYQVRLVDPTQVNQFRDQIRGYAGVQTVDIAEKTVATLNAIVRNTHMATLIAFGILCVVSLFIISNMVRISVFARAEEIGIMKYVGATNAYIRTPYVLEGALIGAVGAGLASLVIYLTYSWIYTRMTTTSAAAGGSAFFSFNNMLLPMSSFIWQILLVNALLGILIGSLGSAISVRRHIRV